MPNSVLKPARLPSNELETSLQLNLLQQCIAIATFLDEQLPRFSKGAMAYQLVRNFELHIEQNRLQHKRLIRILMQLNSLNTKRELEESYRKEQQFKNDAARAIDYPIGYIRDSGLLICTSAANRKMTTLLQRLNQLVNEQDLEVHALLKMLFEAEKKIGENYNSISLSQIYFNK